MIQSLREFAVESSDGDRMTVYRWERLDRVPITGSSRTLIRYELDCGEPVELANDGQFILPRTGEPLVPIAVGEPYRKPRSRKLVQSPFAKIK